MRTMKSLWVDAAYVYGWTRFYLGVAWSTR